MTVTGDDVRLTGYAQSVYTWVVRIALAEIGICYSYVEADPFVAAGQEVLGGLTPFGRVPVLQHGDVVIFETAAVLDYLDAEFGGRRMTPEEPLARGRMRQVIGIGDNYGYWPLVRQVFSHGVYAPLMGEDGDPAEVKSGLAAARPVLAALEAIAAEAHVLGSGSMTLADCHLAAMVDYFAQANAGREMLAGCPALQAWFNWVKTRPAVRLTRPELAAGAIGEKA